MTGEQLRDLVTEALSLSWGKSPHTDADAVLRAIRAAGLVVAEPADDPVTVVAEAMERFDNAMMTVSGWTYADSANAFVNVLNADDLALVRVVE